jgi:hypothetical protein
MKIDNLLKEMLNLRSSIKNKKRIEKWLCEK